MSMTARAGVPGVISAETLLIERDWYELGVWHIHQGACEQCGATVAGVFESTPGRMGTKAYSHYNEGLEHFAVGCWLLLDACMDRQKPKARSVYDCYHP